MPRPFRACIPLLACAVFLGTFLGGCGSDDSPTQPPAPTPTSVGGNVSKAPIAGATINIHKINSDGSIGALVAGPFTTDANGNWTGTLPPSASGPYVMVSTGGSYVDEASGATVSPAAGQDLYGILQGTASQVTPLTHATFLAAQARVTGGATLSTAISSATASSTAAFGFNFATTAPSDSATAAANAKAYAALLGGLSTLLEANPVLASVSTALQMDLVLALAKDMADGKLDGLDALGAAILVPLQPSGTAALPALSASDLSAWLIAANAYAASEPTLAAVSFSTNLVWNPSGSNSNNGSGGTITFTCSGSTCPGFNSANFDSNYVHTGTYVFVDRATHLRLD
ncbi:MAG: hypothetical protein ACRENN_09910, partial [Candidatus Eiseniibacteriota bacterium]